MENLVLIDAYAQIYRCYFAIARLTNKDGEPVNALYGIARMLLLLDGDPRFDGNYGAVVFDYGKCTRRCGILPSYKAQRPPMPEDLRAQIAKIRDWMEAFGWPLLQKEGMEADDLIAAITRQAASMKTAILSKDKDLAQLVTENVTLYSSGKGGDWLPLSIDNVVEKFGVAPEHILDYLAMIGDTADNIRGIDGVGPKTAAKLIHDFGGIESILARKNEIPNEKLRQKVAESEELLRRNMALVQLDNILPDNWNGMEVVRRKKPDWQRILTLAEKENFQSLRGFVEKKVEKEEEAKKAAAIPKQMTFDF